MTKEMICIVCPQGCRLQIDYDEKTGEMLVSNNNCNRGPIYAKKELTDPRRTVTATVAVENGVLRRLPVKTNEDVPKDKNFEVMEVINQVTVKAPIQVGDVIVPNVCGLGVDIIATRSLKEILI
jgi:CxxC motif-containing protein